MPEKTFNRRLSAAAVALLAGAALAAEPLEWVRVPNRPAPAQFDTFHGETLEFRCRFSGAIPFAEGADVRLWYQTNGMGAAWWSLPATISANAITNCQPAITNYTLAATFPPSADPGAERLAVFFGAPSNAYAAAQVRFRNSPGATPNDLAPPSVLDWVAELAAATNALAAASAATYMPQTNAYTKAETDARIVELSPPTSLAPATNYTDAAIGAFAATGTVARASIAESSGYANQAETAGTALDAEYAAQLANREAGVSRTAAQIFAKLDAATTTNDVCNIVTNEVPTGGYTDEWIITPSEYNGIAYRISYEESYGWVLALGVEVVDFNDAPTDAVFLSFLPDPDMGTVTAVRKPNTRNALGLARLSDLPTIPTNLATKAEVEAVEDAQESFLRDLETESNRVNNVSASVNVLWSHVYGNSVWIAVTNYLRTIEGVVPSFQLWEVRDGATNCVYSSAEEITNLTARLIKDGVENATKRIAWSKYQSGTGAENPQSNSVTIVSTQNIMLTGGGEWYKCIETDNSSVWVLKSNGLCTFGGDTNGYFRITDDEGNAQFEVVKTASYEVDAIAYDTAFDANDDFTVTYNYNAANPPTLYAAHDLADDFEGEDANHEINSLGISVTWAKNGSGYWYATIGQDVRAPRLFIHAKVLQQGQNAIRNAAPSILDGGLIIGGVKYSLVPYTSGGKTYLTLEAMQ